MYNLSWHLGQENFADYQSKHQPGAHHVAVQPWYSHMENSPLVLLQALVPSNLKGCVGTLKDGYLHKVPLLQAPQIQIREHVTASAVTRETHVTCYTHRCHVFIRGVIFLIFAISLSAFGRTMILPSWSI